MKTLAPVDFKAVAAKGCFVYCYLRVDGSPYYIGIAKKASRPKDRHIWLPPSCPGRIRVLRMGLSWAEAQEWERFYIARYGRKDIGTGILRNLTDGGEGSAGRVRSEAERKVISEKAKARQNDPEWRRKNPSRKGFVLSAETRQKLSDHMKRRLSTPEGRLAHAEMLKNALGSESVRAKMSESALKYWKDNAEAREAKSKAMKESMTEEQLERLRMAGRNALQSDESKAKFAAAMAAANARPEVRARRSSAAKAVPAEVKARVAQARRDAIARKLQDQALEMGKTVEELQAYKKQMRTARKVEQNRARRLRARDLDSGLAAA